MVVAVVGGANRQEDPTSDVQLRPSDCTGDPGLHLDEGVGVESQGLEGGKAEDVGMGYGVCDSLGVDLRGICSLVDFGFAWGVVYWPLDIEVRVGLLNSQGPNCLIDHPVL